MLFLPNTAKFYRKCYCQFGELQHMFKTELVGDIDTAKDQQVSQTRAVIRVLRPTHPLYECVHLSFQMRSL